MLLSMTGFGEARRQQDGLAVTVEVRSINSRYFKFSFRTTEACGAIESQVESVVRKTIKRGTVQVTLRMERDSSADDYRIDDTVFVSYRRQLQSLYDRMHVSESIRLDAILALPGVVEEHRNGNQELDAQWSVIEATLQEALENLTRMRRSEGKAMADDLRVNCAMIGEHLDAIQQRHPLVVSSYRDRLVERLNRLLDELEVTVEAADVVREVGLFAERTDISEEIVRLRSHLSQFESMVDNDETTGRKLDFLVQEMFRETNTIGAKANDAEIARRVVEVKTAIERIREMIQNIE